MGSKKKATVLIHKDNFAAKLNKRLSDLAETEIDPKRIEKDTVVKKLRSKVKETNAKLRAIEKIESKTEALAQAKAEKLAAPQKEKAQAEAPTGKPEKDKKSKAKKKASKGSPEEGTEKKKKKKKPETED